MKMYGTSLTTCCWLILVCLCFEVSAFHLRHDSHQELLNGLRADPNITLVQQSVQNYATYLNSLECKKWADLFAPDGIKYDDPSPIVGRDQLQKFCASIPQQFSSFAYGIVGPILVTSSDGYRAHMQWLLGGTEIDGTAYTQTGFGSFVFDKNLLIATETGYNLQDASH